MGIMNHISGLSLRTLLLLSVLAAVLPLAGAFIGQYGYGLHPCELCIYQRIPYAFIIVIGIAGAFFIKPKRWKYGIALLCVLLFVIDAGIAGYHGGVESGIFKGPTACSGSGKAGQTLEEMRAEIMNAPLVSCAQAMVYIYGLSMAVWNLIYAVLAFCGLSFLLFKNRGAVA